MGFLKMTEKLVPMLGKMYTEYILPFENYLECASMIDTAAAGI
jgi:hypothetical protein